MPKTFTEHHYVLDSGAIVDATITLDGTETTIKINSVSAGTVPYYEHKELVAYLLDMLGEVYDDAEV